MEDWSWAQWTLTTLGVAAGIVAAVWAILAWRKAASSDKAAQESLTIAKRAEERETEVHFVDWSGWWEEAGVFFLLNTGEDVAHDVKLVLYIDQEPYTHYEPSVDGGQPLVFEVPQARQLWEEGRDELAAKIRQRKQEVADQNARRASVAADKSLFAHVNQMTAFVSDVTISHNMDAMRDHTIGAYDVRFRVFWRTSLHTPKDSGYHEHGEERLGPDYERE